MAIYALGDSIPDIHPTAYVHPDATVIGNVTLGPQASVCPQAVIRGDDGAITVGEGTSIQDGAVLHTTPMYPTTVGAFCTVGHLAHLEGCTVHDWALVGAAAMVPGGVEVPRCAMALGVPAKIREDALPEFHARMNVDAYVARGESFRSELRRID